MTMKREMAGGKGGGAGGTKTPAGGKPPAAPAGGKAPAGKPGKGSK